MKELAKWLIAGSLVFLFGATGIIFFEWASYMMITGKSIHILTWLKSYGDWGNSMRLFFIVPLFGWFCLVVLATGKAYRDEV